MQPQQAVLNYTGDAFAVTGNSSGGRKGIQARPGAIGCAGAPFRTCGEAVAAVAWAAPTSTMRVRSSGTLSPRPSGHAGRAITAHFSEISRLKAEKAELDQQEQSSERDSEILTDLTKQLESEREETDRAVRRSRGAVTLYLITLTLNQARQMSVQAAIP